MSPVPRADVCAIAIADTFRGDGVRLCNPIGNLPLIGGRVAKSTFEPDLVLTDGFAMFAAEPFALGLEGTDEVAREAWNPYPQMFGVLWNGKRHVMMGATQVDQWGNQNIACIGDWHQPRAQLLGFRGAPGNTINHTTSYWVPNHSPKVLVEAVDVVCGIGYDRARELEERAARFHEIRRVVTNLGVFDFASDDHRMRLRSTHPGVTVDEVIAATGFDLVIPADVPESRLPTDDELVALDAIDPKGLRHKEVPPE
jgi:acyl CoA:acetate/3-ketoacid CoA transferase beta subunit